MRISDWSSDVCSSDLGGWRAKTEIPADRSSTGVFLEVFNKAEANNRAIIDAAVKAEAAPGTDQRRIADFYNAYLNTKAIEQRGLAPIQGELQAIAALKDKQQLATMLGRPAERRVGKECGRTCSIRWSQ